MSNERIPPESGKTSVKSTAASRARLAKRASRARIGGHRAIDFAIRRLLIALYVAASFLAQPDVQRALSGAAVRFLDKIGGGGTVVKTTTTGGEK